MKKFVFFCLLSLLSTSLSRPDGTQAAESKLPANGNTSPKDQTTAPNTPQVPIIPKQLDTSTKSESTTRLEIKTESSTHPETKTVVSSTHPETITENATQPKTNDTNLTTPATNTNKTSVDTNKTSNKNEPAKKEEAKVEPSKTASANISKVVPSSTTEKMNDTHVTDDKNAPKSTTTTVKPGNSTHKPEVTTPTSSDTPKATEVPPQKARSFDGPSFIGGIILTIGLLAIGFMGFKYYKNKIDGNYQIL